MDKSGRIRIVIVDDQKLFAEGLRVVLESFGREDVEVAGIAANGKEALTLIEKVHPDVVLMDVRMPVMDGVEATRAIKRRWPDVKVMILTTFDDDEYVHDALRSGAIGYILKNIDPKELVVSVKAVHSGQYLISPSVGLRLISQVGVESEEGGMGSEAAAEVNWLLSRFPALGRREAEVLYMITRNLDNHEISAKMHIAEQTVKNHACRIYAKLGVADRLHAIQRVKGTSS
jgi:DNA-binding NarL/FixJ family response regulator